MSARQQIIKQIVLILDPQGKSGYILIYKSTSKHKIGQRTETEQNSSLVIVKLTRIKNSRESYNNNNNNNSYYYCWIYIEIYIVESNRMSAIQYSDFDLIFDIFWPLLCGIVKNVQQLCSDNNWQNPEAPFPEELCLMSKAENWNTRHTW